MDTKKVSCVNLDHLKGTEERTSRSCQNSLIPQSKRLFRSFKYLETIRHHLLVKSMQASGTRMSFLELYQMNDANSLS